MSLIFKDESFRIMGACFEVYNELGNGFLEAVYQEALTIEFQQNQIPFEPQKILKIRYKNQHLGQSYVADFLCYSEIILELKATKQLAPEHQAQALNYLKATNKKLALLINFGNTSKLEYQRIVL